MVFVEHNSLKSDIFLIPYLFHVFQNSCFSGSRFFRVQVLQGPAFAGSGSRDRVQVLEVANLMRNYVVLRTSLQFQGLPM